MRTYIIYSQEEEIVADGVVLALNDVVMEKLNGDVSDKLNDLNGTGERQHRKTSDSAINR